MDDELSKGDASMAMYQPAGPPSKQDYERWRVQLRSWLGSREPNDFEDAVLHAQWRIEEWPKEEKYLAAIVIRECEELYRGRIGRLAKMRRTALDLVLSQSWDKLRRYFERAKEYRATLPGVWRALLDEEWNEALEEAQAQLEETRRLQAGEDWNENHPFPDQESRAA